VTVGVNGTRHMSEDITEGVVWVVMAGDVVVVADGFWLGVGWGYPGSIAMIVTFLSKTVGVAGCVSLCVCGLSVGAGDLC